MSMLDAVIETTTINLLKLAVTELPLDIKQSITLALSQERNEIARNQLATIIRNFDIASSINISVSPIVGIMYSSWIPFFCA